MDKNVASRPCAICLRPTKAVLGVCSSHPKTLTVSVREGRRRTKHAPWIPPPCKAFLLHDIPEDLHAEAKARAKADKIPLRAILLAALVAYLDGDITLKPGRRRPQRGRRPGRSVHIYEEGKPGKVVVQPHRFTATLQKPKDPQPVPRPEAPASAPASAPAPAPEPVQISQHRLRSALAKLRARV